ncbi:hypothetical protein ACUXV3_08535 [Roseobacteraceae bacterium NS-SX3]
MTAHRNLSTALGELDEKLRTLKDMAEANGFLISALKDDGDALKRMEAEASRAMLRARARAVFDPESGSSPNAGVLAVLEEALGQGQTAEIIPFPGRRR